MYFSEMNEWEIEAQRFATLKHVTQAACIASLAALGLLQTAMARIKNDTLDSLSDANTIPVATDNFVRAATDVEFEKYLSLGGGVNQFFHFLTPTPIEQQPRPRSDRLHLHLSRSNLAKVSIRK